MGKPYSNQLREQAISLIEAGESLANIATSLQISQKTIRNWLKIKEQTGNIQAKTDSRVNRHKIKNLIEFKEFTAQHNEYTLKEMADALGDVSYSTVYRALKKIGFTKKEVWLSNKVTSNFNFEVND